MTLPIPDAHARELAALRALHPRLELALIGASALGHHVPLVRATADVDLVMVVRPTDVAALVAPLGWRPDARLSIRWHGPEGFRADVLPATDELLAGGVLILEDGHAMSLIGLDLALGSALDVELARTGVTIRVASAAALAVTKMVAWLDRPTERTKDLGDLARLLEHALDDDAPCRFDPAHPVCASGLAHDLQSALWLGREVREIARAPHLARIDAFLGELLAEDGRWSAMMARSADHPASDGDERVRAMLEAFGSALGG